MKHLFLLIIFSLTLIIHAFGQNQTFNQPDNSAKKTYQNKIYRFSVQVPDNWKLYGQILNDSKQNRALADWGLPPIYSELEKTEIENSVSITAYHRTDINSVQELIASEYFKRNPVTTSIEVDSTSPDARIIYHSENGLEYKGKSYFVFKNQIGYVITFMATPGTYDKNLKAFEEFYQSINYL